MATAAFQSDAFQHSAFQVGVVAPQSSIPVSTANLNLPVNCVLGDGTHELDTKKRASPLEGLSGIMRSIFRE